MKNKQTKRIVGGVALVVMLAFLFMGRNTSVTKKTTPENALLAIVQNDQKAFETFVALGGDVHAALPLVDGKSYSVIEGIVQFDRTNFLKHLADQKKLTVKQDPTKSYDAVSIAVNRNNPDTLKLLVAQKPNLTRSYGTNGWNLIHMASHDCSNRTVGILHENGLTWDAKAKDGANALTLAAEKDCLPVLSYWKDKGADFKAKDGNGKVPLNILKTKKDVATTAFTKALVTSIGRSPASIADEFVPNFYNKRKFPKLRLANKADMLEPEDRPDEAYETADYSEFAD